MLRILMRPTKARHRKALLLGAVGALASVVAIVLVQQTTQPLAPSQISVAKDPQEPRPLPKQPASIARLQEQQEGLPSASSKASPSKGCPPDLEALTVLDTARRLQVLGEDDILFADLLSWKDFVTLWQDTSIGVNRAFHERRVIGERLATQKLAQGQFEIVGASVTAPLQTAEQQGPGHELAQGVAWLVDKSMQENGRTVVHRVRILVGQVPELDEANQRWQGMEALRRDAIQRFVAANNVLLRSK